MLATLFCDIGGVLLTNAWDHRERRRAWEHFRLSAEDAAEAEARHRDAAEALECGALHLESYLQRVVFWKPRPFTRKLFWAFMQSCSEAKPGSLELLRDLARARHTRLATLNNEGRELNEYRIERFELRRYFSVFCSSCYLGARKPGEEIYRRALGVVQARPEECGFVDDRAENLETARRLGLHVFPFVSPLALRHDLSAAGLL